MELSWSCHILIRDSWISYLSLRIHVPFLGLLFSFPKNCLYVGQGVHQPWLLWITMTCPLSSGRTCYSFLWGTTVHACLTAPPLYSTLLWKYFYVIPSIWDVLSCIYIYTYISIHTTYTYIHIHGALHVLNIHLFIHFIDDGHLVWFNILATVKNASVNMGLQVLSS